LTGSIGSGTLRPRFFTDACDNSSSRCHDAFDQGGYYVVRTAELSAHCLANQLLAILTLDFTATQKNNWITSTEKMGTRNPLIILLRDSTRQAHDAGTQPTSRTRL
jgi:hypothetical protein